MNKILLVSKREFLTRVQKKTFLLTTILLPLIIFGFYALIIYFSVSSGSTLNIAVADNANIFDGKNFWHRRCWSCSIYYMGNPGEWSFYFIAGNFSWSYGSCTKYAYATRWFSSSTGCAKQRCIC